MVGIEILSAKKMGYAAKKWLKTVCFGTKYTIHGMNCID